MNGICPVSGDKLCKYGLCEIFHSKGISSPISVKSKYACKQRLKEKWQNRCGNRHFKDTGLSDVAKRDYLAVADWWWGIDNCWGELLPVYGF